MLSRVQNEEVCLPVPTVTQEDVAPLRSLDRHGVPEALVESTPKLILQSRPVAQLKSCLKKEDEPVNVTLKKTVRVTFQLDSKELSPTAMTPMDEHSQNEKC